MSYPETQVEVMRWFGTGNKAGYYDLHGLKMLLDNATTTKPEAIWDWVLDCGHLNIGSKEFWITPRGKVWNVRWAMHEQLLAYPMEKTEVRKVENAGWLRVSKGNALILTKPTRVQIDTLARLRPDLQAHSPFKDIQRKVRYDYAERFDVPEPKIPWTVWIPEIDEREK